MTSERAIEISCDVIQSLYQPNCDTRSSVKRLYEQQAQYSSDAVSFRSRDGIADFFALLSLIQKYSLVSIQSQIADIADTLTVHGDCTVIIDHTLAVSLFPRLLPVPQPEFSASGFVTPAASGPSVSPVLRSMASSIHSVARKRAPSTPLRATYTAPHSPIRPVYVEQPSLARIVIGTVIAPRSFLSRCFTVNLRIMTKIETNELGKIVSHEDVIPVSTLVEGIPFASSASWIARNVVGFSLRVTCATLDFMLGNRQLLVETPAKSDLSQVHDKLIDLLPLEDNIPLVNDTVVDS